MCNFEDCAPVGNKKRRKRLKWLVSLLCVNAWWQTWPYNEVNGLCLVEENVEQIKKRMAEAPGAIEMKSHRGGATGWSSTVQYRCRAEQNRKQKEKERIAWRATLYEVFGDLQFQKPDLELLIHALACPEAAKLRRLPPLADQQ